jgi:hypothetical protein
MAQIKTYKIYSNEDIKRYLNGNMSALEMYALEKQAIEDPMLADAIDGYQSITSEATKFDLDWLQKQLPIAEIKVISLQDNKKIFPWRQLGIAASVIGILIFVGVAIFNKKTKNDRVAFKDKPNEQTNASVVQNDNLKVSKIGDSITAAKTTSGLVTTTMSASKEAPSVFINPDALEKYYQAKDKEDLVVRRDEVVQSDMFLYNDSIKQQINSLENSKRNDEVAAQKAAAKPNAPAPTVLNRNSSTEGVFNNSATNGREQNQPQSGELSKKELDFSSNSKNNTNITLDRNYRFNYKVTDIQGNHIPFSNVSVPADQLMTYSRVDGTFGLFSSDSILNVQVKAAGYYAQNLQLRSNSAIGNIVLQEAKSDDKDVVVINSNTKNLPQKSNKLVSVINEVEPADGFSNYDSYIANNINTNEKPKGEVVLSFDISKTGVPTNITVNQSLSSAADEEAIRLLQQGPKWRAKKKKNRKGKIVINF